MSDKTESTGQAAVGADVGTQVGADNRVVMRHQIALNIEGFRAAPEGFRPRPAADETGLVPSDAPFASVVVPNYNGSTLLPALMDALDAQTFRSFELIVVDDASSDSSVAWLDEHCPDVRVLVHRRNRGFVNSCNTGAGAARGRILILLNSDALPEPEWLAELVQAVCRIPQATIFASKVLLYDQPGRLHTTGDMLRANGLPVNRGAWERDLGQYDNRTDVFGGSGCAVAYRRELWDALGGFDSDFWMYLEDIDLAFRAQLMGAQAVFVPKARVHHHLTATAGGTMASYQVGRNTIWMIAKNMPASLLSENWQKILAAQLGIALDAIRNLRGAEARARLKGQAVGLLTIGRMLAKRRAIQSQRRVADAELRRRLYG